MTRSSYTASSPLLPLLPSGTLPPLAVLLRWLEDLRADHVDTVVTDALPPLNGSLPDVLRLGGIATLLADHQPAPEFRWEGAGGHRLTVAETAPAGDAVIEAFHRGDLPAGEARFADDAGILSLIEVARLEDASACLGIGTGAAWHHVLAALDRTRVPRMPALISRVIEDGAYGAWNPLPFSRWLTVSLPSSSKPWAMVDSHGRQSPVQVVEGVAGPELLTCLELGALEAVTLRAVDEPVADVTWEVEERILDNGLVRAELDALGQVSRLCWRGVFAELAGPAVAPRINGAALGGVVSISILEAGPVRARICVVRTAAAGVLRVTYTLHAHDDGLRVAVAWSPSPDHADADLELDHPTAHRGCFLHLAGELSRSTVPQAWSLTHPPIDPQGGVRWATLGDAAGRGLALVAGRPVVVSAAGGVLKVHGAPTAYALYAAARGTSANLGQLALALSSPGRATALEEPVSAPFRLAELGGLVPLWARRPAEWAGEVVFSEQHQSRGRAWLFPHVAPREAWRVDAAGNGLSVINLTREGDGLEIDYLPGEILIIRWR